MRTNSFLRPAIAGAMIVASAVPLHAAENGKGSRSTSAPSVWIIRADPDAAAALPGNSEPASGDVVGTYDTHTRAALQRTSLFALRPSTKRAFYGPAAIGRLAGATVAAPRPEARLVSGTAWLDTEEEQDILEGRWYFNVTTAKYPRGEIRGMVHATPEPQR